MMLAEKPPRGLLRLAGPRADQSLRVLLRESLGEQQQHGALVLRRGCHLQGTRRDGFSIDIATTVTAREEAGFYCHELPEPVRVGDDDVVVQDMGHHLVVVLLDRSYQHSLVCCRIGDNQPFRQRYFVAVAIQAKAFVGATTARFIA